MDMSQVAVTLMDSDNIAEIQDPDSEMDSARCAPDNAGGHSPVPSSEWLPSQRVDATLQTTQPFSDVQSGCPALSIPSIYLLHLWVTKFASDAPAPAARGGAIPVIISSLNHLWVEIDWIVLPLMQPLTVGETVKHFLPHSQPRMLQAVYVDGAAMAWSEERISMMVLQISVVKQPCWVTFETSVTPFLVDVTTKVEDLLVQCANHFALPIQGLSLLCMSIHLEASQYLLQCDPLCFCMEWRPTKKA